MEWVRWSGFMGAHLHATGFRSTKYKLPLGDDRSRLRDPFGTNIHVSGTGKDSHTHIVHFRY